MSEQILSKIRVLELGQLIAGPFAAKTLADFGAEIIKIESPKDGDPLRKWRMINKGTSVWWESQSRSKKSVCIDLNTIEGQNIIKRMVESTDVLIENFRPGTMEKWGLSWEILHKINPKLIMLRVSGYGQTGPKSKEPGFAAIAEAMSGLRYLNGEPGRIPVRGGLSLGDTISGLHGAIGILLALYQRDARGGTGQMIDVSLFESLFNLTESLLPEYSAFNTIREPAGSSLPGIVPSNAYPCIDGNVLIAGNGDGIFKRLMIAINRVDLANDITLSRNDLRAENQEYIDEIISKWTSEKRIDEVIQIMQNSNVPCGKIYTVKDISEDPHYRERNAITKISGSTGIIIEMPSVFPILSKNPGKISSRAPKLGEQTFEVLKEIGIQTEEIKKLIENKIIG